MSDVLVLRALGLGDACAAVAALRGVRRAWPGARLHLAGPPGPGAWLRGLGVVDEVIPAHGLEPLAWDGRRHVAVNLHGRGPVSHRVLAATRPARLVAFACPDVRVAGHVRGLPAWDEREHEVARWCRLLRAVGGPCGPQDLRLDVDPDAERPGEVLIHPGAAAASRRWPERRWARIAAALVAHGMQVALTGVAGERGLCERVADATGGPAGAVTVLAGGLDVPGLARRVAGARLLVCGDTGVAHVATAVGTPSVLLFGPTAPERWGPAIDPELHTVLWHGDDGAPGDPHGSRTDPVLARIGSAEVVAAAEDLLARPAVTRPAAGRPRTSAPSAPGRPPT
ncbi:glycosyltransferase family 9 protein [Xylanimonas protaetiae]|uniref:Glycosyltransferase family 9 protein n=1 Tax=Xylanimonas protaetiae TaxID=2509457 RepID=A0A4P6F6U7_9MICO|nr:glycosyltransferase family 9 protein [Xylanimonas protaetiae]QAY71166.1 glycosyltransferase family 9 protein [Xylanimonas protaetiae]